MLVGGLEHFLFSIVYGLILPIDFHIFQRGGSTKVSAVSTLSGIPPQLSVGLGRNPPLTLVGSHWRWRFPRAAAFFARRFCLLCSVSFVLADNTFAPGQGLLRKRLCQQFCIGLHPLAVFDPGCKPHPICNSIQFYLFLVLRLSHWLSHDPGICA